jgi:hypothetical protein
MNTPRATIVSVALGGCLAIALPSYATIGTQLTVPTQQVGSGQWGAAPSATSLDFGTQGVQQIYITVTNTGTLPLTGATYTVSGSNFKVGTTLSLVACVGGTWVVSTNVCNGGVPQTIVSSTGGSVSASVSSAGLLPAALGSNLTVQAVLSKNPNKTSAGTVTVTVNRSQVRAATVLNS